MGSLADFRTARRKAIRLVESDAEVAAALASKEDLATLRAGAGSAVELIARACDVYAARRCLGFRPVDAPGPDGALRYRPDFVAVTYRDLWRRVIALATGLQARGLASVEGAMGICGFAGLDWVVADLAALYCGAVSVPLQPTLPASELERIARQARLRCLVCSYAQLTAMQSALAACDTIIAVVVIDEDLADPQGRAALARWRTDHDVLTIGEVERIGADRGLVAPMLPRSPESLVTIAYTSGSTGGAKGVMYPDGRWAQRLESALAEAPMPLITVGYLPLHHMAGRLGALQTLMRGGVTYFVPRADMSTLFEDIRRVRPTVLTLIPRVSEIIHQHYQTEIVRRGATDPDAIKLEMGASFLGDRLCMITTGAAPTSPEVLTFLEQCFEVSVFNAYGSTELGLISVNGRVHRDIEYRLADVPELGYSVHDQPHPRGELLVRTPYEMPGYFDDRGATEQLRDADGYLRSGDIVEERGPGHLVWIDRKNNIVRLAQGEFVAVSRLEEAYRTRSPFIGQIYIHGNPLRSYLLAVVVPEAAAVDAELARREGVTTRSSEAQIKDLLRGELERVAAAAGLPAHEVPRDFLVEPTPFTRENELLNDAGKPRLAQLRKKYGPSLEALYEALETQQIRGAMAGMEAATTARKVEIAFTAVLGYAAVEAGALASRSFVGLGGDSLAAVRLAAMLEQMCGVAPPVAILLDPRSTLSVIAEAVDRLGTDRTRTSFEGVHGPGATRVQASDLRIARFLADELRRVPAGARSGAPRTVLLTGGSGFLGRFLLLALLERLAPRDGRVVCIVRAADQRDAREKLRAQFMGADPELLSRFDALAGARLEVHEGDLLRPRLGLAQGTYDDLGDRVDGIVHAAALVNHALSYPQLFEPNVLGTVEVLRLALHRRLKAVSFVSSIGVVSGRRRRGPVLESEDARALSDRRPVGGGPADYGVGYATTKWASELLLQDLHASCDIPVNVYRCSLVLPHRRFHGQINHADVFSRLLYGLLDTGLAPRSFYAHQCSSPRHYDGIPVDVVADAIASISTAQCAGHRIYHVSNFHRRDGVCLDRIVDWVASAGRPLERIDDYETWFRRFREALEQLDERRRRRSPLPALERWERPIEGMLELDTAAFQRQVVGAGGMLPGSLDEQFIHHVVRGITAR